jgi:O-antigen/teichoic acid export membrane protein
MEEVEISQVKKKSIRGIFALIYRTFTIQVVGFMSIFLLGIFLSPSVFGVFYIVSAVIAFLSYFSDIGLAAALIQKKDSITDEDLRTTFTIQQILVVSISIIALSLSPFVSSFYNLGIEGIWLFRAFIIAFFLSSLKTIPSIILERNLHFEKLVIPQIVETLFFNITVVSFAVMGFGITSFTIAVLARGISGLIAMYIISPWRMRFGFSRTSASKLLSFGIPFQTNSLLALIKDDLLIAYVGKVLPLAQVGYIGFAQKWAFTPLRLIMDNVIRVTFPSFSRLQEDKDFLAKAIEKSIFAASFIIFPAITGLIITSPYFIHIIPKYGKWEPALVSLGFFALNAVFSSVSTPLTNVLNAIGKVKTTLYLMIFWTIATWVLTPLLIVIWGFNGVAIASAIISTSSFGVVYIVKRKVNFNFIGTIIYPFISSILMGMVVYFLSKVWVTNIFNLIGVIVLGAILYFASMFLMSKKQIISDINLIRENIKK